MTDFRTNVRFWILVRHGRLSEKIILVVGQMSVSTGGGGGGGGGGG